MATDPTARILSSGAATAAVDRPHLAAAPLLDEQIRLGDTRLAETRGGERTALLARLLAFTDVSAAAAAGALGAAAAGMTGATAWAFTIVASLLWFISVFAVGLYNIDTLGAWASGIPQLGRLSAMALAVSWPLAGVATVLGADHPVVGALASAGVALLLALAGRTVVRGVLHRVQPLRQRTVILGSGYVAAQLTDRLRRHSEFGLDPIGIVDDDAHAVEETGLDVLGRLDELPAILARHDVDRVVIAFTRASHQQLLAAMRACRERRVAVDVVPRLFEFLEGARSLDQIGGLPVLSIGAHRLSRSSALAKRALDVAVSSLLILAAAPVMVAIAVAIKLDSRGPVLFRQPRAGRRGEPFRLVKFRSMHAGADERKTDLLDLNEQTDVMFKIRRDPRVTRVGSAIRRLSLDELPQLFNVLRGEMSLVGPRPLVLPESGALAKDWHARRLDLRPGLTGPWQISGRSDLSVHDMVRLDFQYATGWSLARDLEILLATLPVVAAGRGAY